MPTITAPRQEASSPLGATRLIGRQSRVGLAIACLAGIAFAHLAHAPHKLEEAPFWGVAFLLIAVASAALAIYMPRLCPLPGVWMACTVLAIGTMVAYVVSRTIPVPGLSDHVGHWVDPAGLLSLVFEAGLVAVSVSAVRPLSLAPANVVSGALLALVAVGSVAGLPKPAAGHEHAAGAPPEHAAGAGHDHAAGAGQEHGEHGGTTSAHFDPSQPNQPDLAKAGPKASAEAEQLLAISKAAARARFPSWDAARKAGYAFIAGERGRIVSNRYFVHLSNRDYMKDGVTLDPLRPESLVYWIRPNGDLALVGYMFRSRGHTPTIAQGILRWHRHQSSPMAHLWLTDEVRTAFQQLEPKDELKRDLGLHGNS